MAALPPRKNPTPTRISKQHLTPLQTLLQMGFPKHRAERALAATGNRSVQLASDWLLAHVHDPSLDDNSPREYILYACPMGEFLEQLQTFWEKSLELCGWNGAHNYIPHITLVSFFKAPDESAPNLAQALKTVMEKQGAVLNEPLKLETYTSPNFMGFFVAEEHADYLKRIAMQYVKEISNDILSDTYEQFDALTACFPWCTTTTARCIPRGSRSINIKPHVQSLHLSLAYQFPSSQYTTLKALVDELDPNWSGDWELRLYSRDPRVNGKQVYKVIHPYVPVECDELELRTGDFVYINGDALSNSPDGWVEGTSWLTGQIGFLPASFTERTAEMDAWTLHKKVALNCLGSGDAAAEENLRGGGGGGGVERKELKEALVLQNTVPREGGKVVGSGGGSGVEEHAQSGGESQSEESLNSLEGVDVLGTPSRDAEVAITNSGPRRLFLMRHGERVDFVFGSWIPYCFDDTGKYLRKDLNMPPTLPQRHLGPKGYHKDSPLTRIGLYQATLVGEGLHEAATDIHHVYCSPALRCVQTCDAVLRGMRRKDELKIRVEPGLFEWLAWYPDHAPDWMTPEELAAEGFNIDLEYTPFIERGEILETLESCEQFYLRSHFVTQSVLAAQPAGNVLFVGHTATLEVCSRELLGRKPRSLGSEMTEIIRKVPYCALLTLAHTGDQWEIVEGPCPPVTHSNNQRFEASVVNVP